MGLLDQVKDFASSDQGKSLLNQAKDSFGKSGSHNSSSSDNKLDQGRTEQRGYSGKNNDDDDDYPSSNRQAQNTNDDCYAGNNDNEYGGGSNFQGQSGGAYQQGSSDQKRGNHSAVDQDFGARGGVSARGDDDGDNFGSVNSGGYGTNDQGDSFSDRNQSGFDNQQNDGVSGDYC